jgi:CRP/FNR family cyclic AMP-dependent transcriptional regulator
MRVEGVFRAATKTMTVPAGTVIFSEGDSGGEMYGIVEGRVTLSGTDGVRFELGQDEVFGEMAIIDSSPRMATATATTDSVLTMIDRRQFLFLSGETPMFALQVMATMAERLRHHV